MLGDHPPKCAGVWSTNGLTFVENGRTAMKEWGINNVGVSHNPADIRGRPIDIAGIGPIDIFHTPLQGHKMAAIITHHPFGHTCSAGGVKNIQGICGRYRHTIHRLGVFHQFTPIQITPLNHRCLFLGSLQNDTCLRFGYSQVNSRIKQRFIHYNSVDFNATGSRDDELGLGIVNTSGQFVRRKTTKNNRVNGPNPSTGQHGNDGFGNHGHIDDNPVTFFHPLTGQHPGKT